MSDGPNPQTIAEGRFLRMVRSNGWEFVQRTKVSGIVGILAVTDDGKMVLVEQYRRPLDKHVIEVPAGLAGDVQGQEQEALTVAAHRELLEETGYQAQHMAWLAAGAASAGLSDEVITLFRATGLKKVAAGGGDDSEDILVHEIPLPRVRAWLEEMAQAGRVIDLKVYSALYFATESREG